jgi:hypothetical protein
VQVDAPRGEGGIGGDERHAAIRVDPGIMARLRSQTLNIARANRATNIAEALWAAALDPTIGLSYCGL